jgi:hypothetical protein
MQVLPRSHSGPRGTAGFVAQGNIQVLQHNIQRGIIREDGTRTYIQGVNAPDIETNWEENGPNGVAEVASA